MASAQASSLNGEKKEQDDSFLRAVGLISLPWITKALHTAWDLGVFEVLAEPAGEQSLSAEEIAGRRQLKNPEMLDKLLKVLACYGVVGCSLGPARDRLYSLNSVSKHFVPDQTGASLKPIHSVYHLDAFDKALEKYKECIVEGGIPFSKAHGMPLYEYNGKHEEFNQVFNESIRSRSTFIMRHILENYPGFKDLKTLVDAGGGTGITLASITSKYPSLTGINFDLPHVVQAAPSYPGVEHIGGDMFEGVPTGDAILLKSVLHNWGDEDCIKLLKNCYDSIPDDGKLIIVERIPSILPDGSEFAKDSCTLDMVMSVLFSGGQERSLEQYKGLATKAGFTDKIGFHEFPSSGFCVIEFFKS